MKFVPKFIYNLMGMKAETIEIPALAQQNSCCPAGFQDITLTDVLGDGQYTVCANYEERKRTELLSEESCPACPYNPGNIRKRADEKLEESVREFIKTSRPTIS
jgi:hypothetical protein